MFLCCDGLSLDLVDVASVDNVRDLYVDMISPLPSHLGLQRGNRSKIRRADMAGVSEISRFADHGTVNARPSSPLFLLLLCNAGKQLEPEFSRHLEPRVACAPRHSSVH
eukprot:TRINITY_DN1709_c0_g1_i1.p1 TRINITY_DN1709_c0_g1~~TRINITY_DN1709_c0_g1_i1.p1  ORF type:complete len:109 (+),score=7.23 TRINITY_DN1709_c0_g1_i1:414-740(+)